MKFHIGEIVEFVYGSGIQAIIIDIDTNRLNYLIQFKNRKFYGPGAIWYHEKFLKKID